MRKNMNPNVIKLLLSLLLTDQQNLEVHQSYKSESEKKKKSCACFLLLLSPLSLLLPKPPADEEDEEGEGESTLRIPPAGN